MRGLTSSLSDSHNPDILLISETKNPQKIRKTRNYVYCDVKHSDGKVIQQQQ